MSKFSTAQASYDAMLPPEYDEYDWDTIGAKWDVLEAGGSVTLADRGVLSYKESQFNIYHFDDIEDFAEQFTESQKIYNEYD